MTHLTISQKRLARTVAGAHRSMPVEVVPGDSPPRITGEAYYWTWTPNPDGTRVRSNAGRGKFRTYYHASTLSVEVGATWVAHRGDLPCTQAACFEVAS